MMRRCSARRVMAPFGWRAMIWRVVVALEIAVGLAVLFSPHFPVDFNDFWQAGHLLRAGQSPYLWPRYHSPIWIAAAFAPLTLLPFWMVYLLAGLMGLACYLLVVRRYTAQMPALVVLSLACPLVWFVLWYGNLDLIVLAGLVAPPGLAVWLLLSKPQIGVVVAAALIVTAIQQRRTRQALLLSLPLPALAVSFAAGMRWASAPYTCGAVLPYGAPVAAWTADVHPWGLMIGLPLIWQAWQGRRLEQMMAGTLLSAPYVSGLSWIAALPAMMAERGSLIAALAGSWIVAIEWRARL